MVFHSLGLVEDEFELAAMVLINCLDTVRA